MKRRLRKLFYLLASFTLITGELSAQSSKVVVFNHNGKIDTCRILYAGNDELVIWHGSGIYSRYCSDNCAHQCTCQPKPET